MYGRTLSIVQCIYLYIFRWELYYEALTTNRVHPVATFMIFIYMYISDLLPNTTNKVNFFQLIFFNMVQIGELNRGQFT